MRLWVMVAFLEGVMLVGAASAEPERYSVQGFRLFINTNVPFRNDSSRSIGPSDVNELYGFLEDNPDLRTVVLTSDGGSMAAAEDMANTIEKFGLDTEVQPTFSK